jgi:putative nucleotidyltransferase with HDIG domain
MSDFVMAQSIRVDQLKLGSRLAADVYETNSEGLEVLLYARDQVISSQWQLSRLRESGTAVVPVSPDSVRISVAAGDDPACAEELQHLRAVVDASRRAEAGSQREVLDFFVQAQGEKPDLAAVEDTARELGRMGRDNPELLDVLSLLREAAPVAFRHSQNVASLATRITLFRQPGATEEELRRVALAGLLHDVGLLHCVSLEQINRSEVDETAEVFRDHPDFGVEIVKNLAGVPSEVRRAVAEHHERINGNGFPQALSGAELHPLAELVGLCDTYERLTHGITYRRALSPVAALNLIQGWARREFHEELVLDFTRALGPWPLGAPVELENGLKGRVTSRRNPYAPVVACRTEAGLRLVDCGAQGLAVRRGVSPTQAELHLTEIF